MEVINYFRHTSGLNLVKQPHSLLHDTKTGLCELGKASNIDVSDSGVISSRMGRVKALSGNVEAMCCVGSFCLAQIDGKLIFILPSFSTLELLASTTGLPLFAHLPGRIYFHYQGGVCGYVEDDGVVNPWVFALGSDGDNRSLSPPPEPYTCLCYYAATMFIAVGSVVYRSDSYAPNIFCLADGFIDFGEHVLDMYATQTCLYVLTDSGVYAHVAVGSGMSQKKIFSSPLLKGSLATVHNFAGTSGDTVVGLSTKGVVVLTPEYAQYFNNDKIDTLPDCICSAYASPTHYYCAFIRS